MPMSPSMPKLSAVPCLIKAKPLRAALNRAGLDKAPTQRDTAPFDACMAGTGKGHLQPNREISQRLPHALTPFSRRGLRECKPTQWRTGLTGAIEY